MTQKSEIGKLGENLACEYLKGKGYLIIERNFRKPWGELDIIARQKDGTLVFVEVKTMRQAENPAIYGEPSRAIAGLNPEDQLTAAKLKKLRRTASLYAGNRDELINDKKGWRIDLIAINLPTLTRSTSSGSILNDIEGLTENQKDCEVKHYENL